MYATVIPQGCGDSMKNKADNNKNITDINKNNWYHCLWTKRILRLKLETLVKNALLIICKTFTKI